MHIQIRHSDQSDDLATYRRRQAEAFMARNEKQIRAQFWERKRADNEAGDRWLAERGLTR